MKLLKLGSSGPSVQLLQTALNRYGAGPLQPDGIFGGQTRRALITFQAEQGLTVDGVAGQEVHRALLPWYLGYRVHRIRPGETLYLLAERYGSSVEAIQRANPGLTAANLPLGEEVLIPLGFPVVPTDIAASSRLVAYCVRGLCTRYPFLRCGEIGRSVMGKPLWSLQLGRGDNRVLYSAAHHGNEWITALLLLKFTEELCEAYGEGGLLAGFDAREILDYASVCLLPAINPDGMDLVTGELEEGAFYAAASRIAGQYPTIPFPEGWSANIRGVDLNLQYPARWETAREIRFAQGFTGPAPSFYVGPSPLSEPESRALYAFTLRYDPALTLAFHTQGEVIFWQFLDYEPENSRQIGELFSRLSGYALAETPYASSFAGYKDWFIQDFNRPGYTIEAGLGVNPLPIGQFPEMYEKNRGILAAGALVT